MATELRAEVESALARRLVQDPPVAEGTHLLVAALMVAFLIRDLPTGWLVSWGLAVAAAAVTRGWDRLRMRRRLPASSIVRRRVRLSVTLLGLTWGLGVAVSVPRLPLAEAGLLMVVVAGLASAATVTMMADRRAFQLYAAALLLPLAAGMAWRAHALGWEIDSLAAVILVFVFAAFSAHLHVRTHAGVVAHEVLFVERLRAHQELRDAERHYRELVESVSDLVWRGDVEGRWSYVSPACERIYGLTAGELVGRSFTERVHPDYLAQDYAAFLRLRAGGELIDHETVHLAADGTPRHLSFSIRPLRGGDGAVIGTYGIARDVTERAQVARALREARDAAERAARARSEFLANMSHEIRTPMNAVLGMTELLLDGELDTDQRRSLELVRSSGESLLALLNDVLDFSKLEAEQVKLETVAFDLRQLLESVAALFGATAGERGVGLVSAIGEAVPRFVLGDPTRLRQVLSNLLANAVKFTDRGAVVLAADTASADGTSATIRMAVRDTGIGIAAEQLERIFGAFSQADASTTRRYGGTGLGLAIAQRLVRRMGGELEVTSAPGVGSEFAFVLTVPLAPSAAVATAEPGPIQRARRSLRVLLAEDNPVNQQVAVAMLRKRGHLVEVARDGREAVAVVRRGGVDVVLMDVHMPVMDGFEATAAIRALAAPPEGDRLPIVACTANALAGERERCLAHGMDGYLAKPFRAHELFAAVEAFAAESEARAGAPITFPAAPPAANEEPGVDLDAFRLWLRGAEIEDAADAILDSFVAEAAERVRAVLAALDAGDAREAALAAHALKAAAGNVRARRLATLLADLDTAGRAGDLARARALGEQLGPRMAEVVTAIEDSRGTALAVA